MRHETAAPFIGDLLQDRLDAGTRLSVIAHTVRCDDCRDLIDTYLTISAGFRGEVASGTSHPSSDSIVRYAVGSSFGAGGGREWVGKHLEHCNTCSMEVESVQEAERALALREPRAAPCPA